MCGGGCKFDLGFRFGRLFIVSVFVLFETQKVLDHLASFQLSRETISPPTIFQLWMSQIAHS